MGTFASSSTVISLLARNPSRLQSHCEISAFGGHGVVHRSQDVKMQVFLPLNKMILYNVMATGSLYHSPHTL